MLNSKITYEIMIATGFLLSLSVIPTALLGSNSVIPSVDAQTETTTTTSTHQTFHARGVLGNLILPSAAVQPTPTPEEIAGNIVGGEWSLDVVNGEVQNFAVNTMSVDTAGKNFERQELRDLTNVQPGASSGSNNTNQGVVLSGNSTSFTGTVTGIRESGNNQLISVTFNLINGNLANIWFQSAADPTLESPRLPIFGVTTSLTDENGNSLLEGRT
jgi:hypothetical protein